METLFGFADMAHRRVICIQPNQSFINNQSCGHARNILDPHRVNWCEFILGDQWLVFLIAWHTSAV
jgi:hypothetical protein